MPAAKSLQSCPTLCDSTDGSPLGSAIPGILQARTLEWVAISFSSAWKWKVKVKSLSHVRLLATPWTATYQTPPSMGIFRQEYWSGMPLPSLKLCLSIIKSKTVPQTSYANLLSNLNTIWQGNVGLRQLEGQMTRIIQLRRRNQLDYKMYKFPGGRE